MFRHLKLSKNDFLGIKYHTSIIWCIDLIHAWLDENTCSPFLYAIWTKDMRLLLSPLICLKISRPSIFLGQMDYIPKLFTSLQNWSWVHTINLLARKIPNPINVLGAGFFLPIVITIYTAVTALTVAVWYKKTAVKSITRNLSNRCQRYTARFLFFLPTALTTVKKPWGSLMVRRNNWSRNW
jgi:hypothetical protein